MTDEPNAPLTNYWLSWYHRRSGPTFRLISPWWTSGYGTNGTTIICAAVQADSEESAWAAVGRSYEWSVAFARRFCEAKPADWTPFCDRFQRAEWMQWPVAEPPDALATATARAEKAEGELAAAESERAMYRRLHEADVDALAAAKAQPTDQQLIAAKFDALKELCLRKNADYGSTFAKPPCLAPGVKASDAVLVRMSDKIGRLQSLLSGKSAEIQESIADTVSDLSVYGILYLIAREKEASA